MVATKIVPGGDHEPKYFFYVCMCIYLSIYLSVGIYIYIYIYIYLVKSN